VSSLAECRDFFPYVYFVSSVSSTTLE